MGGLSAGLETRPCGVPGRLLGASLSRRLTYFNRFPIGGPVRRDVANPETGDAAPTIFRGVIDFVLREDDGWVVAGHKRPAPPPNGVRWLLPSSPRQFATRFGAEKTGNETFEGPPALHIVAQDGAEHDAQMPGDHPLPGRRRVRGRRREMRLLRRGVLVSLRNPW